MAQSPLILDTPIHDTVIVLKAGPTGGSISAFSRSSCSFLNLNILSSLILFLSVVSVSASSAPRLELRQSQTPAARK